MIHDPRTRTWWWDRNKRDGGCALKACSVVSRVGIRLASYSRLVRHGILQRTYPLLYHNLNTPIHYCITIPSPAIPSTHGSDLTCPNLKRWPLLVPGGPSHPPPRVLSRDTLPNSATSSKHIRRPVVSLLQARRWRRSSHGVSGRDRSFGAEARESMMLAVTVCHYSLDGL